MTATIDRILQEQHLLGVRSWEHKGIERALVACPTTYPTILRVTGFERQGTSLLARGDHEIYVPEGVSGSLFDGCADEFSICFVDTIGYENHVDSFLHESLKTLTSTLQRYVTIKQLPGVLIHPIAANASAAERFLYDHLGFSVLKAREPRRFADLRFRTATMWYGKEFTPQWTYVDSATRRESEDTDDGYAHD